MKVYVAAPWTHKAEAERFALLLEANGHTITKKWWEHREVGGYLQDDIEADEYGELVEQADEDISGVHTCDAFVLLNLSKSEGKAVETGYALSRRYTPTPCKLILVGPKSNLFHYIDDWYEVARPEEALDLLGH